MLLLLLWKCSWRGAEWPIDRESIHPFHSLALSKVAIFFFLLFFFFFFVFQLISDGSSLSPRVVIPMWSMTRACVGVGVQPLLFFLVFFFYFLPKMRCEREKEKLFFWCAWVCNSQYLLPEIFRVCVFLGLHCPFLIAASNPNPLFMPN